MTKITSLAAAFASAILLAGAPALADQASGGCAQQASAAHEQPATPPTQGEHSGTAPGGAGSTGWTGGTGGSYIGTVPAGATPGSPNAHPEVARGLDPLADTSSSGHPC